MRMLSFNRLLARRIVTGAATCWIALHVAAAAAASIQVNVIDQNGAPLADAIVYATPVSGKAPALARPTSAAVDQIKRHFVPMVSAVQAGTSVTFPNKDNFEHDVYSFSPAKRFEVHLYHNTPANPVVFDKPGLVVMGCNIHDTMVGYLMVVDTPWFAKTDAAGHATLDRLPADMYTLTAWHYRLADAKTLPTQALQAGGTASFKLNVSAE